MLNRGNCGGWRKFWKSAIEFNFPVGYNGMKYFGEKWGAVMSITVKDVEHVAALARLELTEEEKDVYAGQLNAILKYAEQLNALDTEGVEPTSHAVPLFNVMREDTVKPSIPVEVAMLNAPEEEDRQFKVPAVLE